MAQAKQRPTDERDPPTTFEELRETPIRPDDLAVPFTGDKWYYILRRSPQPAGGFDVADSTTLAEAVGCEPDTAVVVGVDVDEANATPGVETVKDLPRAVEAGDLDEVALPTSTVVVAVEEFVEARRRGEWSGLDDYLREVSR